jgi:3-oxoacyl-[acyl-carrier protein] reductase
MAGQVALVSGATGALGSAICRRLLQAGMHVEMLGRDAARLRAACERLADDPGAAGRLGTQVIDIGVPDGVAYALEQVAARRPRFDLLVNAAGDGPVAPLLETTETLWQASLQGKLMGTVRLTRAVAGYMARQGGGHVVIVNGTFAKEPHPLFPINSTVNCALAGFAKAVSHDLGPRGIRVNLVNPGITASPLWAETARQLAERFGIQAGDVDAQLLQKSPLGRFATPADVAEAVWLLARPASGYLNGTTLDVDGGALCAV